MPVPFSIVAVVSGRSKRLHNDGTVVLSVGRSKSVVRMGKERVSAESAKRERAWRHICFLFVFFFFFRSHLTERAVATEKMEQPASSKAAGPVFVVRTCTRVNASTSVHDYLVLPLTRPGGDAALRPFCWRQVSQLYVKADKTDALEDIVEELQIRDLSRQEAGLKPSLLLY